MHPQQCRFHRMTSGFRGVLLFILHFVLAQGWVLVSKDGKVTGMSQRVGVEREMREGPVHLCVVLQSCCGAVVFKSGRKQAHGTKQKGEPHRSVPWERGCSATLANHAWLVLQGLCCWHVWHKVTFLGPINVEPPPESDTLPSISLRRKGAH
eukprot:2362231-Amphidinium_carterae.1